MDENKEQTAEDQSVEEIRPPEVAEDKPRSGPRPWLAVMALIVAAAALALSAWLWQQVAEDASPEDPAQAERSAMSERIGSLESQLGGLESRVDALAGNLEERFTGVDELAQSLGSTSTRIDAIQDDLARMEEAFGQRIEALAQREGEQRQADRDLARRMLMIEAASLLRFGQERAELAADWPAAREAFRRASTLLQQADDPRLGSARRELARELDALESIDGPDWLRIQARIDRVAGQAHRWPRPPVSGQAAAEASADDEPDRAWTDSLKSVFGQLVRVRPRATVALSDEEVDLLRRQVGLRLTAAELAAARRDEAELVHHLQSAGEVLGSNFDATDPSVVDALRELQALTELSPASAPAGLGGALAELREYMDRS